MVVSTLTDIKKVAIIGAGPGGLASARFLKSSGFEPVLIDSHTGIGGQWDHQNKNSGVWPEMRTNTFRDATCLSDIPHSDETSVFPKNGEIHQHLRDYADKFTLLENAYFSTKVTKLSRCSSGYELELAGPEGTHKETFPKVVIASGRYNKPRAMLIPGLDDFTGHLGVKHTFNYKSPEAYRDANVIVAGGSISALEIASDLTMLGAKSVALAQRRQRYVMPKMVSGVPFEYFGFTYGAAVNPADEDEFAAEKLLEFALKYGGDPARYGAPAPNADITKAGFTGSAHYLNLVAEERLKPRPWISKIEGDIVTFTNGDEAEADAIILGTGFALNLPFLSDEISNTVGLTDQGMELSNFTFHPDLPGLAFVGLWAQNGGYFTPIEQQARYVSYVWSDTVECDDLDVGLQVCLTEQHHVGYREQNEMALRFAKLSQTDPLGKIDDDLTELVMQSATTGLLFRLVGPQPIEDAQDRLYRQFARFGPQKNC